MSESWHREPQEHQIDRNEYDFGNYRLQPRQFARTQKQLGTTEAFNKTIFEYLRSFCVQEGGCLLSGEALAIIIAASIGAFGTIIAGFDNTYRFLSPNV